MTEKHNLVTPENINESAFKLIGSDWMLVTAGNLESWNTMTASWGGFGHIWNKNVCWCVVRPQRHTYGFMEKAHFFTLCFFDEKYRKVLNYCGTKSGRDVDKAAETGITPVATEGGAVYFAEARLIVECRKIYFQDLSPNNFLEASIQKHYPDRDYHRLYMGEVVRCLRA